MVPAASARAHTLKLVDAAPRWAAPVVNRRITPAQAPGAAQLQPPAIAAADPRWVLAVRAAVTLSGGRAAILPPEKRRGLDALARQLGLRPFDAALVIAIVQDAARRGESLADRGGGSAVASQLSLVRPAHPQDDAAMSGRAAWVLALTAVLFAGGWFWLNW